MKKTSLMKYLGTLINTSVSFAQQTLKDPLHAQALALWTAAFVTGLVAVEYARIFKFLEAQVLSINEQSPYLIFAITPLCLILACWLVYRLSPEAAGSGIPQIMAANEMDYRSLEPQVDKLLSLRVAGVKVVSSLLAIGGGAAIGREGPTLQISACIFHFFGQRLRRYFPKTDSHTWIIAGAAAGLASAFNTPLGGIVYAIEEMGTLHFQKIKHAAIYFGDYRGSGFAMVAWPLSLSRISHARSQRP
jgi:H+/Cl- antiporter ClcA